MPCPMITEGLRQELLAILSDKMAFVPRRDLADSFTRSEGGFPRRFQLPGSHQPGLAVRFRSGVYSSLATNHFAMRRVYFGHL